MTDAMVLERVKGYIDGTMLTLEDGELGVCDCAKLDMLKEIRELISNLEMESMRSREVTMGIELKKLDQRVKTLERGISTIRNLHGELINLHAHHLDTIEEEVFGEKLQLEAYSMVEDEEECEA